MVYRKLLGAVLLVGLQGLGCATTAPGDDERPKAVELRLHLAADQPQTDWEMTRDEHGQPLFVSPQAFLTAADVRLASTVLSDQRTLILLELASQGQAALQDVTTANTGARLAVFLDGQLVMSPVIRRPLREGKIYLDGEFGRAQAEELVARFNANLTLGWQTTEITPP